MAYLLGVVLLALCGAHLVQAGFNTGKCVIKDENGDELPDIDYLIVHTVDKKLMDTAKPGEPYYTFSTEDFLKIESSDVSVPPSKKEYIEYNFNSSAKTITLTVMPSFDEYEINENSPKLQTNLVLLCVAGKSEISIEIDIEDINNHDPTWDPTVNDPVKLSMPYPTGLPVAVFKATDRDITNPGVVFTLDAAGAELLEFTPAESPEKGVYTTTLKTVKQLRFEKTTTFVVTVTDTATPSRSSTATFTIEPDIELSTPPSPRFKEAIYMGDVNSEMTPNSEIVFTAPISFAEGYDSEITLALQSVNLVPSGIFEASLVDDQVKIILRGELTEELLALPHLVLTLEATRPKAANTGRTVILLSPPFKCDQTTTPEPTTTPTTITTSDPGCECNSTSPTTEGTTSATTPTTPPTTSQAPDSSIKFEKPEYTATIPAKFNGHALTVKAVTVPDMTVKYGIQTESENIHQRVSVDDQGRIWVNRLGSGVHYFQATAEVAGTVLFNTTNVYISVTNFEDNGDVAGFANSLTVVGVLEGKDRQILPPSEAPPGKDCVYSMEGNHTDWFHLDTTTGALTASIELDREHPMFADMKTAQLSVQLNLVCTDHRRGSIVSSLHSVRRRMPRAGEREDWCIAIDQVENSPQNMAVVVVIEDDNDNKPEFVGPNPLIVGYPSSSLLEQIQPSSLTTVLATDKDTGLRGKVAYSLDPVDGRFHINQATGVVYMMQSNATFTDQTVKVLATDMDGAGNTSSPLEIRVKILSRGDVSEMLIERALLEDIDGIIRDVSSKTELVMSVLSASVIPRKIDDDDDDGDDRVKRQIEDSDDEERQSALRLVVYAVDYVKQNIVPASELAEKLEDIEFEFNIQEVHALRPNAVYETSDNAGLLGATIALGVICGILLIASGVMVFFSYIKPRMDRNSHMKGLIAHGYDNSGADSSSEASSASSSHQGDAAKKDDAWMLEDVTSPMDPEDSYIVPQDYVKTQPPVQADTYLTIEDGNQTHSSSDVPTYDDVTDPEDQESDDAKKALERRKSMVRFNESVDCIEIERL